MPDPGARDGAHQPRGITASDRRCRRRRRPSVSSAAGTTFLGPTGGGGGRQQHPGRRRARRRRHERRRHGEGQEKEERGERRQSAAARGHLLLACSRVSTDDVSYPFILDETKQKAAATARRGEDFEWGSGRVYIGAMEGRGRAWWRCARSAPSGRTRWRRGDKDNARGGGVRTREAPLSISRRHRPDRTPEHRNPEEADEKHADEGTRATRLQGLRLKFTN